MKNLNLTRRALLARACQVSTAGLLVLVAGCADNKRAAACFDPTQLGESENSLRTSLNYTDHASDPGKTCSGCAYFQASAQTIGCGQCTIVNGNVAMKGHCTSWTAKT